MNSSNSQNYSYDKQPRMFLNPNEKTKKKKDYICPCGRSYGSYPALYSHIKRKHDGKAPGEVIKPKPLRRRGRPFKYEPVKLQTQTPHKRAAMHLEEYLRNVQREEVNQFPLRQFAEQDQFRLSFMNSRNNEEQMQRFHRGQNLIKSNGSNNGWNKSSLSQGASFQENGGVFPISTERYQGERNFYNEFGGNQDDKREFRSSNQQYEDRLPKHSVSISQRQIQHLINLQNYKHFINQHPNLSNQMQSHHPPYDNLKPYNDLRSTYDQGRPNNHLRTDNDIFQSIYSKPFQIALNQQMQEKFKPIAQGISDFLEPILKEIINTETEDIESLQKVGVVEICLNEEEKEDEEEKNRNEHKNENGYEKGNEHEDWNKKEIVQVQLVQSRQQGRREKSIVLNQKEVNLEMNEGKEYRIQQLLQNQHFRDILKWVMSPPQQVSNRQKENYIESSFRCCLVQFLDFVNNFLQTVQYEQVLLMLVFFCDHILASTGSFQLRPQPQIYEMGLYFNSFIHSYLPQLIKHLPVLENFYLFAEFKKKTSELLMWLSSWQAMQQYYHNRDCMEMMVYEISQENYKAFMYQKKYQFYIAEANKHNIEEPIPQHSFYPENQQIRENQQVEEKAQENPQIIIFNQENINNVNPLINPLLRHDSRLSSQIGDSEQIQEDGFEDQKDDNNLQSSSEVENSQSLPSNSHPYSQSLRKDSLKENNNLLQKPEQVQSVMVNHQDQHPNPNIDHQFLKPSLSHQAEQKQPNPQSLQVQNNLSVDNSNQKNEIKN